MKELFPLLILKIKVFLQRIVQSITPTPTEWKGASYGLITGIVILLLIIGITFIQILGWLVPILFILSRLIMGFAGAVVIYLIFSLYKFPPGLFRWALIGSIVILSQIWPGNTIGKAVIILISIISFTFVFAPAWSLFRIKWSQRNTKNKITTMVILIIGLTGICLGTYWLLTRGWPRESPENASLKSEYKVSPIGLGNPANTGNYQIKFLTYGSGKDLHREAFGKNADILTDSVNGSPFVGNWGKFHGWVRTKYWGFDEKALPLNAMVWYPAGTGPFPLVLIVHGNHLDQDYSEPGYEYLGKLMASRGFICVSVDENFLNSSWANIFDNLQEENDCRAWLLLKHLEKWHEWNRNEANPFFQKVDTTRIALIGHSRGGEAVAIAGLFNDLPYYPDDASISFNFGFQIRSIIAIAPVDGQYKPAKTGTILRNVNYFTIQGVHDMDMTSYHGAIQFQRTYFSGDEFYVKAGVYVHGANHGQFNTVWGNNDVGIPGIALYNRKLLLLKEDQMTISKVFITAFLEATLLGKKEYLALFRDYRSGLKWIPETIYLNQYEDTNCKIMADYEEDINLVTTNIPGSNITTNHLTVWREREIPLKWRSYETRGVYLGWNRTGNDSLIADYTINMGPTNFLTLDSASYLYFNLADANENSNPKSVVQRKDSLNADSLEIKRENEKKSAASREPIDFSIRLRDREGNTASVPVSRYAYLQPQLEARLMKADFMSKNKESEIVFQSYFLPFQWFSEKNYRINLSEIIQIQFVFDQSNQGVIIVDNIGIWKEL
jgi:hypothetical protein